MRRPQRLGAILDEVLAGIGPRRQVSAKMLTVTCDWCGLEQEMVVDEINRTVAERNQWRTVRVGGREYHCCGGKCEGELRRAGAPQPGRRR